jgi:hypothetical protein
MSVTAVVRQKCVRRHSITLPCVRNGDAGRRGAESGRSFRHSRAAEPADIVCPVLNESSIRDSKRNRNSGFVSDAAR